MPFPTKGVAFLFFNIDLVHQLGSCNPAMTTCKNCDAPVEGRYCSNCSQRADTHRFNLYHFGHEFLHALTHTDKGILFLIRELFYRPGHVAREYNNGRRKKYFNPITFLLIIIAVNVYAIRSTNFYGAFVKKMSEYTQAIAQQSAETRDEMDRISKDLEGDMKKRIEIANDHSKLINFLFIPILSFLTWLFFKKSGNNYAENIVFNILVTGQATLLFLLLCIIPFLMKPSLVVLVFYSYFILSIIYYLIAYHQFFRQKWGWTILKGLTVQILYLTIANYAAKALTLYL